MRTPFVTLRNLVLCAIACTAISSVQAQTTIPASLKAPPGSWDPGRQGMVVIAHQQDAARAPGNQNSIANVERQLRGDFGLPNIAAAGPHDVDFLNFSDDTNVNRGFLVAPLIPEAALPGVSTTSTANYVCEVLGFLNLPSGETTFYVHCDDTFRFTIGNGDNPQDVLALQPDDATAVGRNWEVDPVPFTIAVPEAGVYPFRILYGQGGGAASLELFTYSDHEDVDGEELVVGKEVGEPYETHNIDAFAPASLTPASAYTSGLDPFLTETEASPLDPIRILLTDGATTTVNDGTITLAVNDVDVTSSIEKSKVDGVTQVSYEPENLLRSGQHTIAFSFEDSAGVLTEHAYDFLIAPFAALPTEWAYPVGSGVDLGFNGKIVLVRDDAGLAASLSIGNDLLAGRIIDPTTSLPFENLAVTGEPDGAFTRDSYVNYATDNAGNAIEPFGVINADDGFPNEALPGVPGSAAAVDELAVEFHGFIELTAGTYIFGVHASDVFELASHSNNALDIFRGIISSFGTNRGGGTVAVPVTVESDGLYPIRLMHQASTFTGSSGVELWTAPIDDPGTETPVNSESGFKVYRTLNVTTGPYVTGVTPLPSSSGVKTDASIVIEIKDLGEVTPVLKVRGTVVEYQSSTVGGVTTLTYTPDGGFPGARRIGCELAYGGTPAEWSFATETGLVCAFVNGGASLNDSDGLLAQRLSEKYGFDVLTFSASPGGNPNTNDVMAVSPELIVISSTINSGHPAEDFNLLPIPIINWEQAYNIGARLNIGSGGGAGITATTINIVDATHPIAVAAGLNAGTHTFRVDNPNDGHGDNTPGPNAVPIADWPNGQSALFVYPAGAAAGDGFIHPADRVFLGYIGNVNATTFTDVGWKLFDASIEFLGFDPATIVEDPEFTGITTQDSQVIIEWTGDGELRSAEDLDGSYSTTPSQDNPQTVTPSKDAEFFQVIIP